MSDMRVLDNYARNNARCTEKNLSLEKKLGARDAACHEEKSAIRNGCMEDLKSMHGSCNSNLTSILDTHFEKVNAGQDLKDVIQDMQQ